MYHARVRVQSQPSSCFLVSSVCRLRIDPNLVCSYVDSLSSSPLPTGLLKLNHFLILSSYPSSSPPSTPIPVATNTPLSPFHSPLFTLHHPYPPRRIHLGVVLATALRVVKAHPIVGSSRSMGALLWSRLSCISRGGLGHSESQGSTRRECHPPPTDYQCQNPIFSSFRSFAFHPSLEFPFFPIKKGNKVEWRERWMVISGGMLRLCKDRNVCLSIWCILFFRAPLAPSFRLAVFGYCFDPSLFTN
ncbi:hypothetical protein JAAARDRAFT_661341 [Jaapia argillacea MUCL 33604]|uniref:Uncharacterized protein n=1 Tax=Jaapia argillacea MUCL 33604 TaxID=933084 RepID=A0A067PFT5_9AGAM|nr:hypothetical protein JAAARDRAFT_661341 [Jaapia argillacea MUCL 33604]